LVYNYRKPKKEAIPCRKRKKRNRKRSQIRKKRKKRNKQKSLGNKIPSQKEKGFFA